MTYVDLTEEHQRIISFCTGIRGIERGIERINPNIRTVAYVEVEAFIIQNMVAQMEAGLLAPAPIWPNARTFPAHIFRNKVDGITGGYPCQGESIAGLRELENYPGYLWPALRSSFRAIGPVWGYFENVDDHLSGTFKYVLDDLRRMGYAVEVGVYTAEEVGAPHERQRVFILAVEKSVRLRMRRRNSDDLIRRYKIQTPGSGSMAYTADNPWGLSNPIGWEPETKTSRGGKDVVNAGGLGSEQEYTISAGRNGAVVAGEGNVANTAVQGLEEPCRPASGQPTEAGEELANSAGLGESEGGGEHETDLTYQDGEARGNKLADADNLGAEGIAGTFSGASEETESQAREENRERYGAGSGNSGENVAIAQDIRQQGFQRPIGGSDAEADAAQTGSWPYGNTKSFGVYPARPGEQQFPWEEPRTISARIALPNSIRQMGKRLWQTYKKALGKGERKEIIGKKYATIESGVGGSAHGYVFREDFLRALGNSVLEDVTVFSFIDLNLKHIENARRKS
jgi:DNA (cytosine-5)-methyltransferase 1